MTSPTKGLPRKPGLEPRGKYPGRERNRGFTRCTLGLFALIIAANVVAAILEAGPNLFLPDNPEKYLGL